VDYFDIIDQAVTIIEDPKLQEGFATASHLQGEGDNRVFGELNTGDNFVAAETESPEVNAFTNTVLFIIFRLSCMCRAPFRLHWSFIWMERGLVKVADTPHVPFR
jgi:hypothetical protein